ncbi:MAG: hypothetical protein R2713_09765 [Ilumatobacteraceae bacterium]
MGGPAPAAPASDEPTVAAAVSVPAAPAGEPDAGVVAVTGAAIGNEASTGVGGGATNQ